MNHKFRVISLVVACLALIVTISVRAAEIGEGIRSLHSDITIQANGRVSVIERIEYNFPIKNQGFTRSLNAEFVNESGNKFTSVPHVSSVIDESGSAIKYSVGGGLLGGNNIVIGDTNNLFSGSKSFIISYEVDGILGYGADRDELSWDVTGAGWNGPLERVSAAVHLPDSVPPQSITVKCYTNLDEAAAQDCLAGRQGPVASFAGSGPIRVKVGWAPGLVDKMSAKSAGTTTSFDYRWLVSFILLFLVAGKLIFSKIRRK